MTVAVVLAAHPDAGQPDAGQADARLRGQLAALGVRRVDAAGRAGPGLLAVAAAARAAGERVLICVGDDSLPEEVLARLLGAGGTAAFAGDGPAGDGPPGNGPAGNGPAGDGPAGDGPPGNGPAGNRTPAGALVVDTPDLGALADAAESLARRRTAPAGLGVLLGELGERGVGVRVLDGGPDGDGAVARWIVYPVARHLARWAAGRQLAPAALLGICLALALVAAAWFTEPATRARVLAAAVLLVSFIAARAAVQLTGTERPRPAVAWLAVAAVLLAEFMVLAALAVSTGQATRSATQNGLDGIFGGSLSGTFAATWGGGGQVGVWRLAVAAMLLLGARRLAEECYEGLARGSGKVLPRPARTIAAQVITLPAGERVAVIAVTAVCFGPRLTFEVLLAWGAVAAGYVLASQVRAAAKLNRAPQILPAYRGDGPIAYRIGGVVQGQLPPLPPLLVGLLVTCDLVALGVSDLPGVLIFGPVMAMLLAAMGSRHPHGGRLDWLVPSLLLAGEGIFLAGLGFARHVWLPVIFALLAAIVTRHLDLAWRARSGHGVPADRHGLGWDGRVLLAGFAAVFGFVPAACAVLAVWLWLLAGWDFLGGWLRAAGPEGAAQPRA